MVVIAIFINEFNQLKLFYIGTFIHESHDNILFLKIFKFNVVNGGNIHLNGGEVVWIADGCIDFHNLCCQ